MTTIHAAITIARPIPAPLDAVRAAIHDPAWSRWIPFLSADRCEGRETGAARVCTMVMPGTELDGYELNETILENDEVAGRFAYAIANPPFPVGDLRGTFVTEAAEDGTLAQWTSTFTMEADALDALRPQMMGFYLAGLQGLEAFVLQRR